jgi:hypothetical protein
LAAAANSCRHSGQLTVKFGHVSTCQIIDFWARSPKCTLLKSKLLSERRTLQPLIAVIANSLEDINSVVIVLDTVRYKRDSVLTAIDITLKIFQVLNLSYPPESDLVWLFVQRAIYNIKTKRDTNVASVLTLMSDLGITSE